MSEVRAKQDIGLAVLHIPGLGKEAGRNSSHIFDAMPYKVHLVILGNHNTRWILNLKEITGEILISHSNINKWNVATFGRKTESPVSLILGISSHTLRFKGFPEIK